MKDKTLRLFDEPIVDKPSLVVGFDSWMDGGNVSSGTVDYLRIKLGALPFGQIETDGFYVLNVPGPTELAAVFRPNVRYKDGQIQQYDYPTNRFFVQADCNLLLFAGKEPNLDWDRFAEAILSVCRRFSVERILYVGSMDGLAPHSRDPRVLCTLSRGELKELADKMGFHLSQYEGPGSFVTHLMQRAVEQQIDMIGLIAETPVYLQGYNPKCIETMVRCVSSILGLHLVCDELRALGEEYENRVTELVGQQPDLAERVEKLEESYDNEIFDTELSELKTWLHRRGIRLD